MNTHPPLPADVTSTIDNLVRAIRSGTAPSEGTLRGALEALVHAGVTLGESRQSASLQLPNVGGGTIEIRSRPVGAPNTDDDEVDAPLHANACRAVFDAPRLARDARTLRPCGLERGHSGKHENSRGVSWSSRTTARTTIRPEATRSDRPMNTDDLKARTKRLARQMSARSTEPSRSPAYGQRRASGPLDAARRAVDLSKQNVPSVGWMPSQILVGMRALERAGEELLRTATATQDDALRYGKQAAVLRQKLLDVHALSLPGAHISSLRQKDIEGLAAAVDDLLKPLEERERANQQWARSLARGAAQADKPRRQPEVHPWAASAYGSGGNAA